jgi:hypothetical protein
MIAAISVALVIATLVSVPAASFHDILCEHEFAPVDE